MQDKRKTAGTGNNVRVCYIRATAADAERGANRQPGSTKVSVSETALVSSLSSDVAHRARIRPTVDVHFPEKQTTYIEMSIDHDAGRDPSESTWHEIECSVEHTLVVPPCAEGACCVLCSSDAEKIGVW